MTGAELVVGGWFASAVIGKFVNKADDYLNGNRTVHKEEKEMLDNLKNKLVIIKEAEKQHIKNEGLMELLQRIKDAVYEAEDLLDDFEAKRIREDLNRKDKVNIALSSISNGAKKFILPNKDVRKLKKAVSDLEELCTEFTRLLSLNLQSDRKGKGLVIAECGEESQIFPHKQRLFGRDTEQILIFTIILGYEIESLESETMVEEMTPGIESHEAEGMSCETESLECETISERGTNFTGESSKSDVGPGQNILGMIKQKFSKLFIGENKGEVGGESSQETTTRVEQGTGAGPESNPMSSGRGKRESSEVWSASTDGVKRIKLCSSQDKTQKLLLDLDPKGQFGRPFVIPIVGISGVGKTALARTIFEHPILKDHFHKTSWVYVSRGFNVRKIAEAFLPNHYHRSDNSQYDLKKEFAKNLEGWRFLLVLDDVCSDICSEKCSQLLDLLSWFKVGAYGSVILITTRENNVADILGTIGPIKLDPLEWNYFLPLLEHYAFENYNPPGEKKDALKRACAVIGRQLHGIPQAAKILGKMLQFNMDVKYWESTLYNNVLSFLEIAYEHLDSSLKQCFAFCSSFPTDYSIQRDRIIQMWIANNFIQLNSNSRRKPEDIGKIWFSELVNFSFFVPTPLSDMYTMNRALREVMLAMSSNEFFYSDHPNPCPYGCFRVNQCTHGYSVSYDDATTIPPSTRHLTVRTNKPAIDLRVCSDKLRTLLFLSDYYESPVIEKKRHSILSSGIMKKHSTSIRFDEFLQSTGKLRILELSVGLHINAIGQLSHLRFLDLSYSGSNEFPESLCTLCHLQVLDVRGCKFKSLPKHMNHLINLRHLYASNETISLISGIGKLTNLQELEEFRVIDEEGHTIRELAQLKEIGGHLRIVNLENIKDEAEAQEARLPEKKHLKALSLIWTDKGSYYTGLLYHRPTWSECILNPLKPHSDLEELEIINYLGFKLPSWITALVNVRYIYLIRCSVVTLLPLGELPSLHTLHLEDLNTQSIGAEFYGAKQEIFLSLKILKFINMKNWTVWSTAEGRRELFPCLEVLQIEKCDSLIEIPLTSLALSNLRELELLHCTKIQNIGGIFQKRLLMLTSLNLRSIQKVTIPLDHVPNLKTLSIKYLDICFEGDTQSLSNLKTLRTRVTVDLSLPSLKVLEVDTWNINVWWPRHLEQWFMKLSGLVELTIHCKRLDHLPSNFANLVSLRTLTLTSLYHVTSLPEGGMLMPPNLKELYIRDASKELEEQCSKEGEYWNQIAYIPYIC